MELELYYVVRFYDAKDKAHYCAGPMTWNEALDRQHKLEQNSLGTPDYRIVSQTINVE